MRNRDILGDKIVNYVRESIEYDKFNFVLGNRDINEGSVKKIKKSMQEYGWVGSAIDVNENYEIIDGQHRFTACKELGLPVRYVLTEGYGLKEIEITNVTGTRWGLMDYINMGANTGNSDYAIFRDMVETEKFTQSTIVMLFARHQGVSETDLKEIIKTGNFKASGLEQVRDFLDKAKDFFKIAKYKKYKDHEFLRAFVEVWELEGYDHEHMKKKIDPDKRGFMLKAQVDRHEYIKMLCHDIYNILSSKKIIYNAYDETFKVENR